MLYLENVENLKGLFGAEYVVALVVMSAINLCLSLPIARKFLQIIQQSGYVQSEYLRWLAKKDNVYLLRLFMLSLLSLLAYLIFSIAFSFVESWPIIFVGFAFYVTFTAIYVKSDFKRKQKAPLVLTRRMTRLVTTFSLLHLIVTFAILLLCNLLAFSIKNNDILVRVRYMPLCLTPLLVPFSVYLAGLVNKPFENARNKKYIDACKRTLEENPSLVKIGITGSYGKTSVKEILKVMLSEKYKVLATPASYNTPMGICKTVKRLNSGYDLFIAEMGARHEGDIRELCDIVKPDYGIVNGIIEHHMETFFNLERIKRTKAELINGVSGKGAVILTCDNENTLGLKEKYPDKGIVLAGVNEAADPEVYASDVKISGNGSEFVLHAFGESIEVSTCLLGKHNVSNICLAAALCKKLGLSMPEIAAGIARVRPIDHRLEVSVTDSGLTVLDDSYNSNISGTIAALEVLSSFEGRKIVLTPGMVELGSTQDYENMRFGKRLASSVDYAILVGTLNSYKIRDGMLECGFPLEKIYIAKDLGEATAHLKKICAPGDVVLFENDLPDKFS